jgi:hypothetical protein
MIDVYLFLDSGVVQQLSDLQVPLPSSPHPHEERAHQTGTGLVLKIQMIPTTAVASTRDVIKDDFGGKLPSGVRTSFSSGRPRLPHGRSFTRGRVFTVSRRGKNRVHADARVRPRGRGKNFKI